MFGWFGSKKGRLSKTSEVYQTRAAADLALLRAASSSPSPTLVASFFPASLKRIEALFLKSQAKLPRVSRPWPEADHSPKLALLDLRGVSLDTGFSSWVLRAGASFQILCIEHFPGLREEQALLGMLEEISVPRAHGVRFFVGMDDPMMQVFGAEKTVSLMNQLGLGVDEKISHPMVDQAIVNAQKKIQARIPNPGLAESDAEWFKLNAPEAGRP